MKVATPNSATEDAELARRLWELSAELTGATIALLDTDARSEIEEVVRRIQKVETAVEAKFQEHFIDALAIPHKTAPFTLLQQEVSLPVPTDTPANSASEGGRNRRRRRRA